MYLNYETEVSRWAYAWKSCSVLDRTSSSTSLHNFHPYPFAHWEVLGWQLLGDDNRTIISHKGHRGWGRCPSSTMITVSHT